MNFNNQKRRNLISLRRNLNYTNQMLNNENNKSLTPIPKRKIVRKINNKSNNIIYLSNYKSIDMKNNNNNNNNFKTNLTNYKTTNNVNNKYKTHNLTQSNFVYNDNFNNYNNNNNNNYEHLSIKSSEFSNNSTKNNFKNIREKRKQNTNLFNFNNRNLNNFSNNNNQKTFNDDYNKELISSYIKKKEMQHQIIFSIQKNLQFQ